MEDSISRESADHESCRKKDFITVIDVVTVVAVVMVFDIVGFLSFLLEQ